MAHIVAESVELQELEAPYAPGLPPQGPPTFLFFPLQKSKTKFQVISSILSNSKTRILSNDFCVNFHFLFQIRTKETILRTISTTRIIRRSRKYTKNHLLEQNVKNTDLRKSWDRVETNKTKKNFFGWNFFKYLKIYDFFEKIFYSKMKF